MKKTIFLLCIAYCCTAFAQSSDAKKMSDEQRVALTAVVLDKTIPDAAAKQLVNKMQQIVVKGGCAGTKNSRFIITCNADVLTEDITPTAPPMHAYTLNVNFMIGDGVEGRLFSSMSIETKGVGETTAKAYIAALKNVQSSNPAFKAFVEKGKERIVEYYTTQCDFIIKEAKAKADRKEFDEAISQLVVVPTVCTECYNKCMDVSVELYKRKIENDCQVNIQQAKAEMAGNHWDKALDYLRMYTPDLECYSEVAGLVKEIQDHRCADALARAQGAWANRNSAEAATWLAEVSADSKCYPEAQKLQKEIGSNLDEKDAREWDFKLQKHKDEVSITKATIKAIRDIGVAYAEHQQPTYNVYWW